MNEICRLCLSYSTQNMTSLSDCHASLSILLNLIHISSNNQFPTQICSKCINKLTEFNEFRLQVQKNEEILLNQLSLDPESIKSFYKEIKEGIKNGSDTQHIENAKEIEDHVVENEDISKEIKAEEEIGMDNDTEYTPEFEPFLEINQEKSEEHKQSEHIIKTIDFKFKCLTCFEKFEKQCTLVNHYNNVHKSKKNKETAYTLVTEDGNMQFKCDRCDKTYDNKRKIIRHNEVHTDERFHCKICSRTYKTVSEIVRHARAHDGTKLACSFGCGFTTVYSGALKNHESRHKKDFKYKCETCDKSFQVRTWYEQHQNIHKGVKPFVCNVCGMAFHMDRYLTSHRSAVHPDASSVDRYVCVQCSKPCGTMNALTIHLKEHGITPRLLCDLCGKTLASAEQLKTHRWMHLGIRPFKCTSCDKSFSKKCNLKLHLAAHSGARAHACGACGRRYSQRSALLRHAARHHNGSSKSCTKCEKTFATHALLEAHKKLCS